MKKTVLIVDDDASVREALRKVLVDAGYNILLAADGDQAVAQFEAQPVDLLVLDLGLPIRSGWEAFERITNRTPTLPIIVITGQVNQYDLAVAAGVGALMEKPLDAPQLLETLRELLAEPEESRLRRLCGYAHDTRHVLSDSEQLLHELRARSSTPLRGAFADRLRGWQAPRPE